MYLIHMFFNENKQTLRVILFIILIYHKNKFYHDGFKIKWIGSL